MREREVVLTYTGYPDRLTRVLGEFKRVGFNPDVRFDFPSATRTLLYDVLRESAHKSIANRLNSFSCTLAHYNAIAETYSLGYDTLTIFEDDIRFLKDADLFRDYYKSVPDNFDIAQCEYFTMCPVACSRDPLTWNKPKTWYFGAAFYRLSRAAMRASLDVFEHDIANKCLAPSDHYFCRRVPDSNPGLVYVAPSIPLGVQVSCGDRSNNTVAAFRCEEFLGISYNDYMPF